MIDWRVGNAGVCAALMAAGAVLLALPRGGRLMRVAWGVLLAAGLANALALNLQPTNLLHINLIHHYLGAKYPIPYRDFYSVVRAAEGQPQIGYRDLAHPTNLVRAQRMEQRGYYIDVLRADSVQFNPLAPFDSLARWARASGAVEHEADRILRAHLPEGRIDEFRADVRRATAGLTNQVLIGDYGFNGSPFYALLRQADPTLHFPFGPAVGWLNLAWQVLGTLLLAWIAGAALGLDLEGRLAIGALLFASWDFVGYALPGLIFAEVWLPVALAALALRHRKAAAAGVAIAWAGLVKLFPFVMAVPAAVRLIREGVRRAREPKPTDELPKVTPPAIPQSFMLLAFLGLATPELVLVALVSGRSWSDFFAKILAEFHSHATIANSVSVAAALQTLGFPGASPLVWLVSLCALGVLAAMFWAGDDNEYLVTLPRRSLVLVAALGWVFQNWLNYYALVPLLLLPAYARTHRAGAVVATLSLAAASLLPGFDDPLLLARPGLHGFKLLPYVLVPAWMVMEELRHLPYGPLARRVALVAGLALLLLGAEEVWRARAVRQLDVEGQRRLQAGDAAGALQRFGLLTWIAPRAPAAFMNQAIALAALGEMDKATASFARAAALAPESPAAQDNYGRALMMMGRLEQAAQRLEIARRLSPDDPQILMALARVRRDQNRREEAMALFTRAQELDPDAWKRRR